MKFLSAAFVSICLLGRHVRGISRPVELLTMVHGGLAHSESAVYPFVGLPRNVLLRDFASRNNWSYSTAFLCDPFFTPGAGNCFRRIPGGWARGSEDRPWSTFLNTLDRNRHCNYLTNDTLPLPEYIAHAAVSSQFSAPAQDVTRVMVLFTHASPAYTENGHKASSPFTLDCQDSSLMSVEQFRPTLEQTRTFLYVVAQSAAIAIDWRKFAARAGLDSDRMVVWEAGLATIENYRTMEESFRSAISFWDFINPLPPATTAPTTTTRPTTTKTRRTTTTTTTKTRRTTTTTTTKTRRTTTTTTTTTRPTTTTTTTTTQPTTTTTTTTTRPTTTTTTTTRPTTTRPTTTTTTTTQPTTTTTTTQPTTTTTTTQPTTTTTTTTTRPTTTTTTQPTTTTSTATTTTTTTTTTATTTVSPTTTTTTTTRPTTITSTTTSTAMTTQPTTTTTTEPHFCLTDKAVEVYFLIDASLDAMEVVLATRSNLESIVEGLARHYEKISVGLGSFCSRTRPGRIARCAVAWRRITDDVQSVVDAAASLGIDCAEAGAGLNHFEALAYSAGTMAGFSSTESDAHRVIIMMTSTQGRFGTSVTNPDLASSIDCSALNKDYAPLNQVGDIMRERKVNTVVVSQGSSDWFEERREGLGLSSTEYIVHAWSASEIENMSNTILSIFGEVSCEI